MGMNAHAFFRVIFFSTMESFHPLATRDPGEFAACLEALVAKNVVQRRRLDDVTSAYKYCDKPSVCGDARLARGLVMSHENGVHAYRLMPLPKFDQIASFTPDMLDYHDAVCARLPETMDVQPKHDGTCIHAVCWSNKLLVTTFLSATNEQAKEARRILENKRWTNGATLGFELISDADPKIQRKRVANGLHLFYGVHAGGREMNRAELAKIAEGIDVPLVKQQRLSKKRVMDLLVKMDSVEKGIDVQEGMVVIFDGQRYKVKSWLYLTYANSPRPSAAWLKKIVQSSKHVDAIHEAVEAFAGILDASLEAHALFLDLVERTKALLTEAKALPFATVDDVKRAPSRLQPLLHARRKDAAHLDSDAGLLAAFKLECR